MATLTKAMLSDMMKGNASISLLPLSEMDPPADEGQVAFANLDFTDADQIFTIKDSFSISEGDPTTENTQIDQMDEIIDSQITEGDYTMTGQVPSNAQALFDFFYEAGQTVGSEAGSVTGIKGQDGTTTYVGKSYGGKKEVYCAVLVESQSKETAVVFARVRCVLSRPVQENTSTPGYCTFNGYILANLKEGEGNFAVLHKGVVAGG